MHPLCSFKSCKIWLPSKTGSCKNLLEEIDGVNHVRMSMPVFDRRDKPLKQKVASDGKIIYIVGLLPKSDIVNLGTVDDTDIMDPETSSYSVPDEYIDTFDNVKLNIRTETIAHLTLSVAHRRCYHCLTWVRALLSTINLLLMN
ncbi:hypothetical protein K439DRAFT_221174 [Ramaria rubella]|nr:hypothetical protein K439DRAFT_221174 [Ramaria rubella]